jgi:hypothetical protein
MAAGGRPRFRQTLILMADITAPTRRSLPSPATIFRLLPPGDTSATTCQLHIASARPIILHCRSANTPFDIADLFISADSATPQAADAPRHIIASGTTIDTDAPFDWLDENLSPLSNDTLPAATNTPPPRPPMPPHHRTPLTTARVPHRCQMGAAYDLLRSRFNIEA